jgi:hypothetical protein
MANEIRLKPITKATFTITLAGLAGSRQSDMIANTNNYPAALVYFAIESGAGTPTSGTVYEIFLLRGDDPAASTYRTDGAGDSDAAITIRNAPLIGVIVVLNSANTVFYGEFDTAFLGPLGPEWGIAIRNSSGQTLNAVEGNHYKGYVYYVPEIE